MIVEDTPARSGAIYHGWFIVVICMIPLMLAIGCTVHPFGLYVLPAAAEFGLPRASISTGLILINLGTAAAVPVVGQMLDRWSARVIMGISGLMLSACLFGLAVSRDIWVNAALLSFPAGFAISGIGTLTAPALVACWFTARRGRAMAITMMGLSLGTIFVVPPVAWLIELWSWRESLVAVGLFNALVILLCLFFIRVPSSMDADQERRLVTRSARGTMRGMCDMASYRCFASRASG